MWEENNPAPIGDRTSVFQYYPPFYLVLNLLKGLRNGKKVNLDQSELEEVEAGAAFLHLQVLYDIYYVCCFRSLTFVLISESFDDV
jgi:hypothetical protein